MSNRKPYVCHCALCDTQPGQDPHSLWGYDRNATAIPDMICAVCKDPLGDKPYIESPGMARHGDMHLIHQVCETPKAARAREQMEVNQRKRLKKDGIIQ